MCGVLQCLLAAIGSVAQARQPSPGITGMRMAECTTVSGRAETNRGWEPTYTQGALSTRGSGGTTTKRDEECTPFPRSERNSSNDQNVCQGQSLCCCTQVTACVAVQKQQVV